MWKKKRKLPNKCYQPERLIRMPQKISAWRFQGLDQNRFQLSRGIVHQTLILVSVLPFESLIGKLDSENIEYFVMGDLNCNMTSTRYDINTLKLKSVADVFWTPATHLRTDRLNKVIPITRARFPQIVELTPETQKQIPIQRTQKEGKNRAKYLGSVVWHAIKLYS